MSEEKNFMEEALENSPKKGIKPRDLVKGVVVSVKDNCVKVDLKEFTEGTMYLDHYTTDKNITSFVGLVKVGDVIEAEVTRVDNGDFNSKGNGEHSEILLSRIHLIQEENYAKLEELVDEKKNITVKVLSHINGKGYSVAYNGFKFFMPESQSPKEELTQNSEIEVRILELEKKRKSAIVSRRVIEHEEYEAKKNEEINSIKEGDILTGTVSKIEPFGCFVRFNYNQGLIRLNQMSHIFITNINDVVKVGDKIEVKVLSNDNGKLLLSRKALLDTPFQEFVKNHKVGDTITGKVVNKLPFGLLLEVSHDVKGLLHQSEYSWNPNDSFQNNVVIGSEVEVAIIGINEEKEKISLSRKALIDNPWSRVNAKVGDLIKCKVIEVSQSGLKVECLGVEGFIPSREALAEGTNGKVDDFYAVGDEVEALITEINNKEWVLKLSVRKHLNNQERKVFEKYMNESKEEDNNATLGDIFKEVLSK